ncbi:MAG: hypothetical protein V7670_03030 [Maribacter arcticus]|uniref:hypothetical protein n=1 Tax=Maribacter arcticus TaxID=561365 RepID=UPI0030013186
MGIQHKFLQTDFGNGFQTHNAVLDITPYQPKVLFLGTFNPATDEVSNVADFFYGRNWFWPILFNILEHKQQVFYKSQRKFSFPKLEPSLPTILEFIAKHQISFADLIAEVLPGKEDICLAKNKIIYNGDNFDLIKDGDLVKLDKQGEIDWTTKPIIEYIKNNPSIETIYYTRKSSKPFNKIFEQIELQFADRNVKVKYLFTPSGQGLKGSPRNEELMKQWVKSSREGFDNLDEQWVNKLKTAL